MKELIEALTIFAKYMSEDNKYPTACEHDILYICGLEREISEEDAKRLEELGFFPNDDGWASYRYGSC